MSNSVVCTLFEGHYHLGLASLVNSLYSNGFRGSVYAGYRGQLPPWAINLKDNSIPGWNVCKTLDVAEGLNLHFLPLETKNHFANYKPDFMLRLWEGPVSGSENIFYFDPDIVIVNSWLLFEEWITCGVAVSEDVNSPLSEFHPRRMAWRRYFGEKGIQLKFRENIYVNSGFIGLTYKDKPFAELWKHIQETMEPLIGGLELTIFTPEHLRKLEKIGGPFMPFATADQDALNIAVEASETNISFIGKNGMGFQNGFVLMEHAIGSPKPWKWKPLQSSIDGRPPRNVDYAFYRYAAGPVMAFSKGKLIRRKIAIKITALIGRIYKRN